MNPSISMSSSYNSPSRRPGSSRFQHHQLGGVPAEIFLAQEAARAASPCRCRLPLVALTTWAPPRLFQKLRGLFGPAVVVRYVALLKRYLLRYKPSEETLLQIDRFCLNTIAECDVNPNRRLSPWSRSLNQQSGSATSTNASSTASTNASPLPVSSFASGALVKSLNYVHSLVSQHLPKQTFQPAAFAGAPPASRQSLPTLSSLLSRFFNSQLNPANGGESSEKKDATTLFVSNLSNIEEFDGMEDLEYIAVDVWKWRWHGEHYSSIMSNERDRGVNLQGMNTHNFLEVGAAALLVGDMEAKVKGQPWRYFGTADMPYLDQLLQPSSVTTITNSASARSHLRAITASKRTKAGPRQIRHRNLCKQPH